MIRGKMSRVEPGSKQLSNKPAPVMFASFLGVMPSNPRCPETGVWETAAVLTDAASRGGRGWAGRETVSAPGRCRQIGSRGQGRKVVTADGTAASLGLL